MVFPSVTGLVTDAMRKIESHRTGRASRSDVG